MSMKSPITVQGITIPDSNLARAIADKDPYFHRGNFCSVIRCSRWKA